jgi:antitoxin component of MazEF toxin-antitoxin module
MKTTVKKWGSSAAVRIPPAVMEAAEMRVDDLVKGITTQNLHEPVDFGSSQGKEIW